jgi:hypothetical protein
VYHLHCKKPGLCINTLLLLLLLSCRIVAPMSETEKLINKQLLEKVAQAGLGQLAAGPVVRTKTAQQQAAKTGRV